MKLSILIVSWNTKALTLKCVESIFAHAPDASYEVVIVDNASEDGSAAALRERFGQSPNLQIIESPDNLGFARGNNLAFAHSTGELVFLLNPDTEIREDALRKLMEYMEAHPQVGIVGPRLLNADGSLQPSVRRFPRLWSSLLVFSGLHRLFRPYRYLMDDFDYAKEREVEQVMGAALLTRRSIIENLGFLDEKFWLWYEEVDFCKRVQSAGYQIRYYPGASVVHLGAQSFSQLQVYARKRTVAKSLKYYFRKNGSFWDVLMIELAMPVVLFAAWLVDLSQKMSSFRSHPHV
jgi:N-acetylglucosaminyl-diphospho-decaprenol L-rhamnosyltransferase